MWIIFLICCFSCFIGLVLVCKNALAKIIAKIFAVYRRQEFPTKIGILLLLIGAIFFFVTLVYQMNQMQITTDQLTRHNIFTGEEKIVENNIMSKDAGKQLLGPEILLIVISAIVLGFVLVAAGIIKKRKGIFRLSGKR